MGKVTCSLMVGFKMVKYSPQGAGRDTAQMTALMTAGTQTREAESWCPRDQGLGPTLLQACKCSAARTDKMLCE